MERCMYCMLQCASEHSSIAYKNWSLIYTLFSRSKCLLILLSLSLQLLLLLLFDFHCHIRKTCISNAEQPKKRKRLKMYWREIWCVRMCCTWFGFAFCIKIIENWLGIHAWHRSHRQRRVIAEIDFEYLVRAQWTIEMNTHTHKYHIAWKPSHLYHDFKINVKYVNHLRSQQ